MSELFFLPKQILVDSAGQPVAGAKANFYLTTTTTRTDTYTDSALATPHDNPVVADANGKFAAIYLDPTVTYRCILTDADDVQIDDVDPVAVPATASLTISDAGGYYATDTVEAALQEIGANYARLDEDEDISGDWTVTGSINFQDNELLRPLIRDYGIKTVPVTSSGGTATLNLVNGNSFTLTLSENTTIAISNPPAADECGQVVIKIAQASTGGPFTVTWPASVKWPNGSAPTMTTTADGEDIYILKTWDEGTTWYGNYAQAYA